MLAKGIFHRTSWTTEFLAKLLVILLGLQYSLVRGQDSPPQSSAPSPAPSQASTPPAVPHQPVRHAGTRPFSVLPKGVMPKYVPVSPEDPSDPYIIAEAAALNNNPNQIFSFVSTQVAFEAYSGSVRGARGTLWAMAGNTLDKSSLLVALLEAAGYTAQYEHVGGDVDQVGLIVSMFPQVSTYVGCVPPSALTDNPAYNSGTTADANLEYYWVQYGTNGANTIALDPNVPGASPGQSFQTAAGDSAAPATFTTVPKSLRQQVTVKINAELYSLADTIYAGGPSATTVLTQSFDASALVGNIVTAGNLVSTSSNSGLDFSETTYTYTPFLVVGSGGSDITQDQLITGTPYQEFYTTFPLSSQILTGLFLEIDADDYTYTSQPWTHTMFDRLGPAARQGNASVTVKLPATPAPALTAFDLTTANIMTARQPLSSVQSQQTRLTNAYNNYEAFKPQIASLPTSGTLTAAQQEIMQEAINLGQYLTIAEGELITMGYNYTADLTAQQTQTEYYSRVYPNSPRITIASSSYNGGNTQEMLDVLKNDMQVIDGFGQNRTTPFNEELARGMLESLSEASILNQATGQTNAIDIGSVFGVLADPSLLTVISAANNPNPANPQELASTTLTADAQTLILDDVQAGNVVMTPTQMVTVNGVTTVGWWEINPTSGHTVSHFVNGGHQGLVEAVAVLADSQFDTEEMIQYIGRMEGYGQAGIVFAADVLQGVAAGTLLVTKNLLANPPAPLGIDPPPEENPTKKFFSFMTGKVLGFAPLIPAEGIAIEIGRTFQEFTGQLAAYLEGFQGGYYDAVKQLTAYLPADPDSLDFISTPLGLSQTPPTPGTTPGVQLGAIGVDPTFTMPILGNSLPLVFDLPITNTGPSTDTFKIQISDSSQDFQIYPTVPSLTLQGGQSGMVNVCVVPYDTTGSKMPPVGQAQNYSVTVTSATNSAITANASPSFNAPPIPALQVSTNPATVITTPGGTVSASLTLGSVGNISPGAVTITVATIANGITLNGLTSPITVPLGSTVSESLSITAAANLASGSYPISLFLFYTAPGGTQQINSVLLTVDVTQLGTCALSASATATQVGKTTLAGDLGALAQDLDIAAATPSNPALASRVALDMNTIIGQELTATYFQSIVPNLTAAANTVASATAATLPNALSNLSTAVCSIGTLLNEANSTSTRFVLDPSGQLSDTGSAVGPNQSAQWTVDITNNSSILHVYDLSTTGVPSGVTVQFSQPSIAVAPYPSPYNRSYTTLVTLTTGATFNTPFSFNVVATPEDAPEFAVSAPGTLLARPESVNVDQITVTPPYASAGTPITVSARVFAVVNESVTGLLQFSLTDPNGHAVCCTQTSSPFTLTPTSTVQTITFNPIATTGFISGAYTISVQPEYNYALGATATASMLIGAPLSGVLSATPSIVPPGSSTVQVALNITRDTIQNPVSTLVGSVPLNGVPRNMTLFQNGAQQLAYACSDSQVNIVDVTTPASPTVLSTFANDILTTEDGSPVEGYQVVACSTYSTQGSSYFVISYSRYDGNITTNPIPTHFATYSLANPLAPVQVGGVVDIERGDSAGLYVAGTTALMFQSTTIYNPHSDYIIQETGDIWTASLSTPGSVNYLDDVYSCGTYNSNTQTCSNVTNVPNASYVGDVCTPSGTIPVPNLQTQGGPYRMGLGTAVNSTTTYFASTNAYGGDIMNPSCPQISGQLLVVDTTNPSNPNILTSVSAPAMAFMTGVAIQGTTALAVGDSKGLQSIQAGYLGTLVLSSFDISNPTSPQLLNSVSTQLTDSPGAFVVPLGSNTFAVGNTSLNGAAELVLVDASTPSALRYIPYNAAFVANPTIAQNGYFFALSATPASTQNALSVFQLSEVTGPQLTVTLQIPTPGNASVVPNSFSTAPTTVTPGAGFTTYVWNQPTANTITFNMNLSGVNPGDVTTLVNSGQLSFTLPTLGSGTYPLGSLDVLSQHILSISPASQLVNYGATTANYTATITNPSATQQTFTPSAIVPPGWTGVVPPSVTVAANGSQTFTVAITPPANVQFTYYLFNVSVSGNAGMADTVPGSLGVAYTGANLGSNGNINFGGFTSSIAPSQVTVGRGDYSQPYTITVTNTGNVTSSIDVNPPASYPAGLSAGSYTPSDSATVLANASAAIVGTLVAARGTTPGSYPVTIPVQDGPFIEDVSLTVNVSSAGVQGNITPSSGTTASHFALSLTNNGLAQDTFNLSAIGPLAQSASLASTITLAAGATNSSIPITLNPPKYNLSSNPQLQILAVSTNDPNVQAVIAATVTVAQSKSVTASILPATTAYVTAAPGSVSLLFTATNSGNVSDSYTASITGTTGAVTATLGNAGNPFLVTALGTAQLPLNATLSSGTTGTVTVAVTSTSNSAVTAKAIGTIQVGTGIPCDLTQAGSVGILDVQTVIDEALGAHQPLNDINNDGVVNVVDIETCIDQAIGLNTSGPGASGSSVRRPLTAAQSTAAATNFAIAGRSFSVTDLGTLGGTSATAYGLNNLGQVVGSSDTAQNVSHAFLWDAGRMTDLGLLDGANSRNSIAYSINDATQIAGVYANRDRDTAGFFYASGVVNTLSDVSHGRVMAINNLGQIAGDLIVSDLIMGDLPRGAASSSQAFLWNAGTVIDLGTLGGAGSQALAINDGGQVAGFAYLDGNSTVHAFLYSGAGLVDLGTLGGQNSMAFGINRTGQIVGASQTSGSGLQHAFLYSAGAMTDLGTLGGTESQADGIDSNGLAIGWSRTAGGQKHAFLWSSGRMIDLNSFAAPGPGIWLEEATAINDVGQLVANANNGHAYLIALPAQLQ